MKFPLIILTLALFGKPTEKTNLPSKVFDVHLHGSSDPASQVSSLQKASVYKAAISTSWEQQELYRNQPKIQFLYGLMFPCPNGKVPYSLQPCYQNGKEWPAIEWVEEQIKRKKIDFMGELLTQYFGISSSDSLLYPYYRLAEKYGIPVGIHTGGAGPNHGSPNFKWELGNPLLLTKMLTDFPNLKIWIMHGGDQYYKEAIELMKANKGVYADISVLCNPQIVPAERFSTTMQAFLDAGLEDRLLFGSDNAPIENAIKAVEELSFLTRQQKEKIFYKNAEDFFNH
jgi:hypothetical protein